MPQRPWVHLASGAAAGVVLTLGTQLLIERLIPKPETQQNRKPPESATIGVKGDPTMGSANAPVTIVEFSDFECPYCKRFHDEVLPKLKDEYIDKGLVRFIHKDLPLPFHQNAHLAATSARCAQEDGKYWEAYQALFSQQNCLDCQGPVAIIASTGISRTRLDACNRNKKITKAVNINISEAELNGIRATPTFVLGHSSGFLQSGKIIEGAIPWSELRPMINKALEESRADRAKRLDPDLKN